MRSTATARTFRFSPASVWFSGSLIGDELTKACFQYGARIAVAHRNRWHPALQVIDKLIADGKLGRLLEIRGIGPVLERRLAELGVTSFRQIAGWDEAEIDRIADQLGSFRDRIRRDDWVAGAREEYNRKHGRPPGED